MKKLFIVLVVSVIAVGQLRADEGMWMLPLIEKLNINTMQKMGCTLSAEDIYSINQSSLKDAIVLFGGGCTGVVVSPQGLLFTNHHCGYGQVQAHSSLEHDYLTDGFWAHSFEEELPNPGLSVAFLQRMEDVTVQVLRNITPDMNERQRTDSIQRAISRIRTANTSKGSYRVDVKPLYKGNQYFMYVYEIYKDIRLVGAPPSAIGKFGGDTDNWVWPRHTGDFCIFRIYAGKDNQPADYSPDNIPYHPRRHVSVSVAGVRQDDFTMVYGYPAATDEYISSYELDYLVNRNYPARVAMRTQRLAIMDGYMQADRGTRIQYAAKYASVSNAWKKWQGVIRGIQRVDGIEQKRVYEEEFTRRMQSNPLWAKDYGQLLGEIRQNVETSAPLSQVSAYYPETVTAIELVRFAGQYDALITGLQDTQSELSGDALNKFLRTASDFYKDYVPAVDRDIFVAMMKAYYNNVPPEYHFGEMTAQLHKYKDSFEKWADEAYRNSVFRSYTTLEEALTLHTKKSKKLLDNDPFLAIYKSGNKMMDEKIRKPALLLAKQGDSLSRVYMAAQLQAGAGKVFYPDANHTLRVAFGRVEGYSPSDAVVYLPYTTLEGIMEKDNPDIYDYQVPQVLKTAYKNRDYGRYADGKTVPVCFIASNHTSGGNSGSPVFNDKGELIGLNFDRNWEGTMSDVLYDPGQCRNIVADIRYILFVTEQVFGMKRITDEITFR